MHRPALDVIPDDRQPGIAEFRAPDLIRSEEHGNAIDHGYTCFETGLRVILDRALGADREIADKYLGTRRAQRCSDISRLEIDRTEGALIGIVGHVRGDSVEDRTGLNDDVRHRQRALKDARAIRLCENGFFQRMTDFAPVDVERGDKLDVTAAIPADRMPHHAFERSTLTIPVVLDPLYQ